ncbi:hypothetical protein GCM10010274_40950 [Streptomyces lavendofoliae]|uniref:Uncharacterized protein n=1 Tax=Streptomyces lavendofoliae TaxID=67314 RepID=A0A918HZZ8_9ACTN|nr:hypothetical protein GCM10010274_40950 [Streptomyces lavendofoliae]
MEPPADAGPCPGFAPGAGCRPMQSLRSLDQAVATRYDKRGYVHLGTVTAAALLVRLRA